MNDKNRIENKRKPTPLSSHPDLNINQPPFPIHPIPPTVCFSNTVKIVLLTSMRQANESGSVGMMENSPFT